MGWRFRRSKQLGKLLKLNLTKKGLGFSIGISGLRMSVAPDGVVRRSIGIPGTGLYCIDVIGKIAKAFRGGR